MIVPQLSIVLPVYNVEKYLAQCLNSIIAQTFTEWEAILVDDGSTDFSGLFCDYYARKDSRFKVIHQENMGVAAARNVGMETAVAPLLAFIDPDDFISPNYFHDLIWNMKEIGADHASSKRIVVDESGSEGAYSRVNKLLSLLYYRNNKKVFSSKDEIILNFNSLILGGCWGQVYDRDLWNGFRFPVGCNLAEDLAVVPQVVAHAKKAVCVTEAVYYYRKRRGSLMTKRIDQETMIGCLANSQQMYDALKEYAPNRINTYASMRLQSDIQWFVEYLRCNRENIRGKSKLLILSELYKQINE